MELLKANVGDFAEVIHAACTYEAGPLALLNAVNAASRSTGGSRVVRREELALETDPQYVHDEREMPTVTLEEVMARYDLPRIDVLKLDCEGSEYSILEHGPIDRVGLIVGEYHGFERWEAFRASRFPGWHYTHLSCSGEMGNFHLRNPREL
jgi:FkbM family methyltransferase